MRIKRSCVNLAGLILLAAVAAFVGIPAIAGILKGGDNDYAIFPFGLTCIIAFLLILELRKQLSSAYKGQYIEFKFPVEALAALVLLFAYYALFKLFNYYVGTVVFCFVGTLFFQRDVPIKRRLLLAALFTIAYCVATWITFELILGFRL